MKSIPPNEKVYPQIKKSIPPNEKSIPPNEKVYPLMQKSIPPLNYGTNIAPYLAECGQSQ